MEYESNGDLSPSTGHFKHLKGRLSKTRQSLSNGLSKIFSRKNSMDCDVLESLEELLVTSDIGIQTSLDLIQRIKKKSSNISKKHQLKNILREEIISFLNTSSDNTKTNISKPHVIMVVGVNGVGKTTTIGKLAATFTSKGQKVLIAASDTFRAGATEQLLIWAKRAGAEIVMHKEKSDPAAVAYDSIEAALARGIDIVLIDTAGRLHTNTNLMEELKKIKRSIAKKISEAPHEILLVLDATTGQNALSQTEFFNEALGVTGIALTKLDGTAKGGIVISICGNFKIPIKYIGIGEMIEDLQTFDPEQFVSAIL
ncbi:MAG: signal recognition particle-docking protein FtsY [Desulfobacterales bacterium]|nr:signal recognition particle-docking protein FtsY [Desulfobacterales bacterium]